MEQAKYDVFISYSRKDYVKDDVVIPGNPISAIKKMFDENEVKYWIDKDGTYSGEDFSEIIVKAILSSKMVVFVSSKHSNESRYTCGEILKAMKEGKLVIPFLIENCNYNPKLEIHLLPLDYIDYLAQPNTALPKLLNTVKKEIGRFAQKEIVNKIKERAKDYNLLEKQANGVLQDIYSMCLKTDIRSKRCPVCGKDTDIEAPYCERCSWQFPMLYGMDGIFTLQPNDPQYLLAQTIWKEFNHGEQKRKETIEFQSKLSVEKNSLDMAKREIDRLKNEMKVLKEQLQVLDMKKNLERNAKESAEKELRQLKEEIRQKEKAVQKAKEEEIRKKEEEKQRKEDEYKSIIESTGGLVSCKDTKGKFGFASSKTGKIIIPCEWNSVGEFSEGLARVKNQKGNWGFIDVKGKIVIPCIWGYALDFSNGFARVRNYSGWWNIVDKTGKEVSYADAK